MCVCHGRDGGKYCQLANSRGSQFCPSTGSNMRCPHDRFLNKKNVPPTSASTALGGILPPGTAFFVLCCSHQGSCWLRCLSGKLAITITITWPILPAGTELAATLVATVNGIHTCYLHQAITSLEAAAAALQGLHFPSPSTYYLFIY